MTTLCTITSVVGSLFIGYIALKFVAWIYKSFIFKSKKINKYTGKDKWGVVTGCAGGIGAAYTEYLAKKGTNLVLIDYAKTLPDFAKELEEKYNVKTVYKIMDLSKFENEEDYEELREQTKDLNIQVMVNNVGMNTWFPTLFKDYSEREIKMFLNVNIKSQIDMTRKIALPNMLEKKSGLIVNMSSFMGIVPNSYYSMYSAGKSFIAAWTKCLKTELKHDGIEVIAGAPMFVATAMTGIKKPNQFYISPKSFASQVFNRVGCKLNEHWVAPHWLHSVITQLLRILPACVCDNFLYRRNKKLLKYLKKRQQIRDAKKKKEEK